MGFLECKLSIYNFFSSPLSIYRRKIKYAMQLCSLEVFLSNGINKPQSCEYLDKLNGVARGTASPPVPLEGALWGCLQNPGFNILSLLALWGAQTGHRRWTWGAADSPAWISHCKCLCPNADLLSQQAFGTFVQGKKYTARVSCSSKIFIRYI